MPPKRPEPAPPVLCLEDALEAQRADVLAQAQRRLINARWKAGHADGFMRGAIWAARELGAAVVHRPPMNAPPRDKIDGA